MLPKTGPVFNEGVPDGLRQDSARGTDAVGGAGNVTHLEHCSTRLRFTLADTSKADVNRLKAVPGVMGVVGDQPQVVIGNDVVEVHDAISNLPGMGAGGALSQQRAARR